MALGSVTFGGLASGLPPDIVDQLMSSQQTRLKRMEQEKSYYQNQKSAFSELNGRLSSLRSVSETLQDEANFSPHTASASDTDRLSVTADSTALSGNHTVSVQRLATNQTLMGAAGVTSSTDTVASVTTFQFDYNGQTYTNDDFGITAGDTMYTVAEKISRVDYTAADGTSEEGISASVLFDGTNYRLVMTPVDSGAYARNATDGSTDTERIANITDTLTFTTGTYGALSQTISGEDALMTVDGLSSIYSTSNTVEDVIPGVTVVLKDTSASVTAGTPPTGGTDMYISVTNDTDSLKETLNEFIGAFNGVIDYVNSERGANGLFRTESLARSVISQMRNELNAATSDTTSPYSELTTFSRIAELGIKTDSSTGRLQLDTTDFNNAVSSNYSSIADVFTSEPTSANRTAFETAEANEGLAHRMADLVKNITNSVDGSLSGKTEGLNIRISSLDDRMLRESDRLERMREQMTLKFARLEQLMSQMNGTGSALTQSLSQL
ncbi:MAG: flagellar filament capping protein FliD [Magnetococcales bacterium]|nr:flagellar filament capping protein FliD [Magnetococcales bacterium]